MKKEFKKFNGISYFEIKDDRILCSYNVFLDRIRISTGFFKKLNEDEESTIRLFIESDSISPNFVKRMINDYGNKSILSSFIIRECDEEIALEYILRKYKGHFYRNRYPSIYFVD